MKKHTIVLSILLLCCLVILFSAACVKNKRSSEDAEERMAPFPLVETGDSVIPAPDAQLKEQDPAIYDVISCFFPEYDVTIFGNCL